MIFATAVVVAKGRSMWVVVRSKGFVPVKVVLNPHSTEVIKVVLIYMTATNRLQGAQGSSLWVVKLCFDDLEVDGYVGGLLRSG